jgi:anti-sigma factor ChrR (cupin superfamily)
MEAHAVASEPEELLLNVNELEWKLMGEGTWGKILRVSTETGAWTVLFKQEAGSVVPPHRHLAPAELYVLEGCIEYRGGVARAGYFGREPMGALHERTSFPEDTIYLFTSYGPLAMLGPDGNVVGVTDATVMKALSEP